MKECIDAFDAEVQSSDEEDPVVDSNKCSTDEINKQFSTHFHIASEQAVSLKKTYILHSAASKTFDKVAVGLSDKTIQIYNLSNDSLTKFNTKESFGKLNDTICGVQFMRNDPNILFAGSVDGSVFMFDLRTFEAVHEFEDSSNKNKKKTITNFDINQNDRVLCAGTDQIENDVFLLFFDIRQRVLLGGYWESHTDDITQVKFHPKIPDRMASGSVDGLINVFDISNTNEDDALIYSYNTESSVGSINWHKNVFQKDLLSCITHTNDFQLFDVDESDLITSFTRKHLTERIMRESSIDCNLINTHDSEDGDITLLVGSNYNKGECLRSLKYENKNLSPIANFEGNKQIIRTSIFNEKENIYVTGGEAGILSLWTTKQHGKNTKLKEKTKKEVVTKPY